MREIILFIHKKYFIIFFTVLIFLWAGWHAGNVQASRLADTGSKLVNGSKPLSFPPNSPAGLTNANCIMCHQSDRLKGITRDSLQVSLTVDDGVFNQSVHGKAGILCVSCHTTFSTYPHSDAKQVSCEQCHEQEGLIIAKLPHDNRRMMEAQFNETCRNCHPDEYSAKNMHTLVAIRGQMNTPLCTDCHGGHDVQKPADPPQRITITCTRCHTKVSTDFLGNGHHSASPLTQTCADCHSPHEIETAPAEPAASLTPTPIVEVEDQSYLSLWNSTCTMCHAYPNLTGKAQDSTTISLTVNDKDFNESVHGKAGLGCAACHQSITGYPHQEKEQIACSTCHGSADPQAEIIAKLPFETSRAVSVQLNDACRTCHEDEYKASADSMHTKSQEDGNLQAPLCVDCHGSHTVQSSKGSRAGLSEVCAKCHASVYTSYQSSVHGVAIEKGNSPDAPTCGNCHGVHSVSGPSQINFRNQSVATCVRCHLDEGMMSKYGVPTQLFEPDIDQFHGVALNVVDQQAIGGASPTAVCFDCHGVHTIRKADDPQSSVNPTNLLKTCQKCHPDAGSRFVSTGFGHTRPESKAKSILNGVERIYTLLIWMVLGLLVIYILLDGRKRWAEKKELSRPGVTGD